MYGVVEIFECICCRCMPRELHAPLLSGVAEPPRVSGLYGGTVYKGLIKYVGVCRCSNVLSPTGMEYGNKDRNRAVLRL
jgi:hypothetical protein